MDQATDLEYDLRWFLYTGNQFKPEPNLELSKKKEDLVVRMPCLVQELQNQPVDKIKSWHNDVRAKLKSIGFYKGSKKTRPEPQVLEGAGEIGPKNKFALVTNAKSLNVYVYTNPTPPGDSEVTEKECLTPSSKRKREVDCVHCVARHTAKKLAGEKKQGGILLEMGQKEGVPEFWKKLRDKTYGNLIKELHIFGHGLPDTIQIGGDLLTSRTSPPLELWCHFAKDATVVLYGCLIAANASKTVLTEVSIFDWIGNALLCRGGTVNGSIAIVNNQCGQDGLILKNETQNQKSKSYSGCNVANSMEIFLRILDEWIRNNIKVN
jgi:hypothetical protein